MNIKHKSFYKRLKEKVVYETCQFFMHFTRHINFKNSVAFCKIKLGLEPFYTLAIFSILQIEIDKHSGSLFANTMIYGKIRYLLF